MQVSVRHRPSFAVARLTPAPGEPAQVEAGATMATGCGVTLRPPAPGGVMNGRATGLVSHQPSRS